MKRKQCAAHNKQTSSHSHGHSETIFEGLRAKGFRLTPSRKAIIAMIIETVQPLSAPEILQKLKLVRRSVNKTTVYRELDFLAAQRIISEIDILDGTKRYEAFSDHHHHHLVCTSCKAIECVEVCGDLKPIEKRIRNSHDFVITGHVLEFFGVCRRCGD
jgi:Fur family ferric uptake transcriptional regulator